MAILDEEIAPTASDGPGTESVDITSALAALGYTVRSYGNGVLCAVKLGAIEGTRCVHADVTFVIDLRTARFGTGQFAMRAQVLPVISRPLSQILNDTRPDLNVEERTVTTPAGRVRFTVISRGGDTGSLLRETRTVYVVTDGVRPSRDLTWLTDERRVVSAEEFVLIRSSDARALAPTLRKAIDPRKWSLLRRGSELAWWALFPLLAGNVCVATGVLSSSVGRSLLPPLAILSIAALGAGGYIMIRGAALIREFRATLTAEEQTLVEVGDASRVQRDVSAHNEALQLVYDLGVIVSPLMAAAADSLRSGDINGAVDAACSVLDECVGMSPSASSGDESLAMADEALGRFLGLFEVLGANVNYERLALAYVALTGHLTSPLTEGELAEHLGLLNDTFFDIGAIAATTKGAIDDMLNEWAMREAARTLGEDLKSAPSETARESETREDDRIASEEVLLLDAMRSTSDDGLTSADEIAEIEASDVPEDETRGGGTE
ncbi:MAG: hypothetical protein ACTSYX_11865 [Candidatus Thorarchaeota archaeon]